MDTLLTDSSLSGEEISEIIEKNNVEFKDEKEKHNLI